MATGFQDLRRLLIISLVVAFGGGCSLRTWGDFFSGAVYDNPVERQQIDDNMDANWGRE